MASSPARALHEIGVAVLVPLAAALVFTLEYFGWALGKGAGGMTPHGWLVLTLFALPLLLSLFAVAVSLLRRPAWVRWTAAILILLVPQLLMFGVLNG